MNFLAISITAFIALVSALPAPSDEPATFSTMEITLPAFRPITGIPTAVNGVDSVKREALMDLEKRATLTVDVWQNRDRGGRHEGLISDTQRCYNLGNGWNDQISSLSVPSGFGCIFYEHNDCPNNNGIRLTVPGGNYIADLNNPIDGRVMNDKISSYLCYN